MAKLIGELLFGALSLAAWCIFQAFERFRSRDDSAPDWAQPDAGREVPRNRREAPISSASVSSASGRSHEPAADHRQSSTEPRPEWRDEIGSAYRKVQSRPEVAEPTESQEARRDGSRDHSYRTGGQTGGSEFTTGGTLDDGGNRELVTSAAAVDDSGSGASFVTGGIMESSEEPEDVKAENVNEDRPQTHDANEAKAEKA